MSVHSFRRSTLAFVAAFLCGPGTLVAQDAAPDGTFSVGCAGGLSLDLRSNRGICANVRINDDTVSITATEGTADNTTFQDSEWQFRGNVRIALETTVITADSAVFRFADNELTFGELTGSPVELQDFIVEQDTQVRGTAESISYDNRDGTARMMGEATLALGENEYFGCDLVYNLTEKTINTGSADCGVRVVIRPPEELDESAEIP